MLHRHLSSQMACREDGSCFGAARAYSLFRSFYSIIRHLIKFVFRPDVLLLGDDIYILEPDIIHIPDIKTISRQYYTKHAVLRVGFLVMGYQGACIRRGTASRQCDMHILYQHIFNNAPGYPGNGRSDPAGGSGPDICNGNVPERADVIGVSPVPVS